MPYLLNGSSRPVGGATVEWLTWLKTFKSIGCNPALLTWKGAQEIVSQSVNFDIVESFKLDKGIPKIKSFTYELPLLFGAVKKYNPDFIVQECASRFTGILAIVAKLLKKPFIHRIASDMDVDERIEENISNFYLKLYYYGIKNASHISCQNKYQYNILKKKYPDKSISILYNPFEMVTDVVNNHSKEYIAWVGNFRYEKNLPALAKIAKSLNEYKFKIVGTKLDDNDKDTSIGIQELEKLKNVEFVGYLNNDKIPEFLSKSYCLLNTSRLEGFSNTFLEAWSVGIPVISTKNVNPDNLISDYNLGVVSKDYESLPEIIDDFISSRKYLKFKDRCRNYVVNYHNPEYLTTQFLKDMENSTKITIK